MSRVIGDERDAGVVKTCDVTNQIADRLLSRWVDLLNDERDRGLTPSQEQVAYELLAEFLRRP